MNTDVYNKLKYIYEARDSLAIRAIFSLGWDLLGGNDSLFDARVKPNYEAMDELLRQVDLQRLNSTKLVGLATIAYWGKGKIKEYEPFLHKVKGKLEETREDADILLKGLW